ncbi:unnamed protein product [Urochloa humidicola]
MNTANPWRPPQLHVGLLGYNNQAWRPRQLEVHGGHLRGLVHHIQVLPQLLTKRNPILKPGDHIHIRLLVLLIF